MSKSLYEIYKRLTNEELREHFNKDREKARKEAERKRKIKR